MCKYLKMMLFKSKTKKIKYFLDPPPQGSGIRKVAIWLHAQVIIYPAVHDLDFTRSIRHLQSNPFIENYY